MNSERLLIPCAIYLAFPIQGKKGKGTGRKARKYPARRRKLLRRAVELTPLLKICALSLAMSVKPAHILDEENRLLYIASWYRSARILLKLSSNKGK